MKKHYFSLFVLCLIFLLPCAGELKAQSENPASQQELLIEVPELDSLRALPPLKSAILALGGITYVDYCDSQKLIMLLVDRKVQINDKNIIDVITNSGYSPYVKNDGTISQAKQNCKDR